MNATTDSSANHHLLINPPNQPDDLYPLSHTHHVHPNPNPSPHPQPRHRRCVRSGHLHYPSPINASSRGKREREKEKERTKLRNATAAPSLAGCSLAFVSTVISLPARADMNDVLAALARDEPDCTTYRQSSPSQMPSFPAVSSSSLKKGAAENALECQASVLRIDEILSPASLDSVVISERESSKYCPSVDCLNAEQLMHHDADFSATPYVPVYAMLGSEFMNICGQLVGPQGIRQELSHIKSLDVDGVVVECWCGIVEAWSPQKYVWSGYRGLFNIIRDFKLKLQVIMAFHEYEGNDSIDVMLSSPIGF